MRITRSKEELKHYEEVDKRRNKRYYITVHILKEKIVIMGKDIIDVSI